jgi:hypothetical protein
VNHSPLAVSSLLSSSPSLLSSSPSPLPTRMGLRRGGAVGACPPPQAFKFRALRRKAVALGATPPALSSVAYSSLSCACASRHFCKPASLTLCAWEEGHERSTGGEEVPGHSPAGKGLRDRDNRRGTSAGGCWGTRPALE